jgi:hypothetical protein
MPVKEKPNVFGLPTKTSPHTEVEPAKSQLISVRKLLLEEKSEEVVKKLLNIALDDEHPGQMSAIKMTVDRILPMSEFEKVSGASRPTITINIGGINDAQVIEGEEVKNG